MKKVFWVAIVCFGMLLVSVGYIHDVSLNSLEPAQPVSQSTPPLTVNRSAETSNPIPSPWFPRGGGGSMQPEPIKEEVLVQEAFDQLEIGEFFHNVPEKMKTGIPVVIQAGIAKEVTQQLLDQLDVEGEVQIREGIRYDPLGMELKISTPEEAFRVREITTGYKPIISGNPDQWMWEITPLKRGKYFITINAVVELKVPQIKRNYTQNIVVFKEERLVEVNPGYSLSKFTSDNWQVICGFIFGSGSLAWVTRWVIDQQQKQKEQKQKNQDDKDDDPPGFARYLSRGSDSKRSQ